VLVVGCINAVAPSAQVGQASGRPILRTQDAVFGPRLRPSTNWRAALCPS